MTGLVAVFEELALQGYTPAVLEAYRSILEAWGCMPWPREPGYFRLRVAQPLSGWTVESLQHLTRWIEQFLPAQVWVTAGQSLELTHIHYEHMPALLNAVAAAGLSTQGTLGATVRPVLFSPLLGVDAAAYFDVVAVIQQLNTELAKLTVPEPLYVAVEASPRCLVLPALHSLALVGAIRERGRRTCGFDLWVGGGAECAAQPLGVFVPEAEGVSVVQALMQAWLQAGAAAGPGRVPWASWVQQQGVAGVRYSVEQCVGKPLDLAAATPVSAAARPILSRDAAGVYAQAQEGHYAVGVPLLGGALALEQIHRLIDVARRHGEPACVRFSVQQEAVVLNIPEAAVEHVLNGLQKDGLTVNGHAFRRGYRCSSASVSTEPGIETRARGQQLMEYLEQRVHWQEPFRIHVDESPAGEARARMADIGISGMRIAEDGRLVDGCAVWVAGACDGGAATTGFCIAEGLAMHELPRRLEQLLQAYKLKRRPADTWQSWCRRLGPEKLRDLFMQEAVHPIAELDLPAVPAEACEAPGP